VKRRRIILKIFLLLFVLLALLVAVAWLFPQQVLTVDSGPVKADVIVVLGGGWPDRPESAAELFKQGEAPLIICTGYGDADANEACLTNYGVPASDIVLEPKSRTTRENAEFSIPLLRQMGAHRVIIVTSWYHSRRALACFEHYAPDIKFYSHPSYIGFVGKADGTDSKAQRAERKAQWKRVRGYADSEYLKLLGYWVYYGVCPI
jgi:uncharacterized SAM-binding protein YcdF (DUF218 family)